MGVQAGWAPKDMTAKYTPKKSSSDSHKGLRIDELKKLVFTTLSMI